MKAGRLILTIAALAALAAPAAYATDVTSVMRTLAAHSGKYQLEVQNTSNIGYINAFKFVPPDKMTITSITATTGGSCRLTSNAILCTAAKKGIAPPTCVCHPGGSMTVNFTAKGNLPTYNGKYWTYYGFGADTRITSITPVGTQIPQTPRGGGADLPVCDLGTQPTAEHPCVVE